MSVNKESVAGGSVVQETGRKADNLICEDFCISQITLINVFDYIFSYTFSEILNNALDHSKENDVDDDPESYVVVGQDYEEPVSLEGSVVKDDDEAYELYNSHAFRNGFGTRKGKKEYRNGTKIVRQRFFVCAYEGFKKADGVVPKCYKKKLIGELDARSHRNLSKEQLAFLTTFSCSGTKLADVLRAMRKEVGGEAHLGFTIPDAYDAVNAEKKNKLDGCDSNQLIRWFAMRQANEHGFYYDFQLNEFNQLTNFFWRDGRMRSDYEAFGDLLIHDTTYRTNKYDMICGPFVGMYLHTQNIMLGVGFLLNQKAGSFEWLFNSFLISMGGKQPVTIMTDQSSAMDKAIREVFPKSRHRLCTWHIGENAIVNIKGVMAKDGFKRRFDYVLKYTDTIAEFQHYWNSLMTDYNCKTYKWIKRLYDLKEKWCPAYNKEWFSGGILSSQRSETTNHSISRSKENKRDYNSSTGNRYYACADNMLCLHARDVYTIEIYLIFEQRFIKAIGLRCQRISYEFPVSKYIVGHPTKDFIRHVVKFNEQEMVVDCTCKSYGEIGIFCSHILRVFIVHNVEEIPKQYIMKRWTKEAMNTIVEEGEDRDNEVSVVSASVWRMQSIRNCIKVINEAQHCPAARKLIDLGVLDMSCKVKEYIGGVEGDGNVSNNYVRDETLLDVVEPSTDTVLSDVVEPIAEKVIPTMIQNPPKRKRKIKNGTEKANERNVRPKGIVEKKRNKLKGWNKRRERHVDNLREETQSTNQCIINLPVGGVLVIQHLQIHNWKHMFQMIILEYTYILCRFFS
ncbi:protein FAR1-RELATED SEQUENCE 5-like [Spinacia oleracea]|uniref:Protein FAR1-RELATED SEQUENCE 5-like n=1 Tax=Spinacia oleracea TaxID=3562 RepID=A0ABM3RQM6_SPIOL|nr:protein FAR1-RELATED SEQUENCE 5-like [Spinacia oleracea]